MALNRKRDETFPPTMPGHRVAAARKPQGDASSRQRSEAPTLPPPPRSGSPVRRASPPRASGIRAKRTSSAATVDEVVADLTNDPRREEDD